MKKYIKSSTVNQVSRDEWMLEYVPYKNVMKQLKDEYPNAYDEIKDSHFKINNLYMYDPYIIVSISVASGIRGIKSKFEVHDLRNFSLTEDDAIYVSDKLRDARNYIIYKRDDVESSCSIKSSKWINKGGDRWKFVYLINGWEESKNYFLSFHFDSNQISDMMYGYTVEKDGDKFCIRVENEDGHSYYPCDVLDEDELDI